MCFISKSKQTVNSPQKIPSMVYYQAIFTLSFLLLYLFYLLFLPRMPGNSLLVEVSQYWKKKKKNSNSHARIVPIFARRYDVDIYSRGGGGVTDIRTFTSRKSVSFSMLLP